jgi:hypothetical protein
MADFEVREIDIDNLLFDLMNPRHDILNDQANAMRQMIDDQGEKLINLANDILEEGTNPADLTMVVPDENEPTKYVVVEGNRRVAAIQLLLDPVLAKLGNKTSVTKFFEQHHQQFKSNPISKLTCVVFKTREDANHWIRLKHTGENKGVGVVAWGGIETARFRQRLGKSSLALQVVEFVKKNSSLDKDALDKINKVPITNIARLIDDPYARSKLGIDVSNSDIVSTYSAEEVIKGLTKVVLDVAEKEITVNDIRSKKDRQDYLANFDSCDLPDLSKPTQKTWSLQSHTTPITPASVKPAPKKKGIPLSTKRKMLIPAKCTLIINHIRLNKIYDELQSLKVDDFENACAVMLRVFLELSLDEYSSVKGIPFPKNPSLVQKLNKVSDYLENNGLMTKAELKPVRVACSNPNSLFSPNTLNAYVHNPNLAPKSKELKETWDEMQKLFETIWPQ